MKKDLEVLFLGMEKERMKEASICASELLHEFKHPEFKLQLFSAPTVFLLPGAPRPGVKLGSPIQIQRHKTCLMLVALGCIKSVKHRPLAFLRG